jgi:hypothetical protein
LVRMEILQTKKNRLFNQAVITEVNQLEFAQTAGRKSPLAILGSEKWGTVIFAINHGVRIAGEHIEFSKGVSNIYALFLAYSVKSCLYPSNVSIRVIS